MVAVKLSMERASVSRAGPDGNKEGKSWWIVQRFTARHERQTPTYFLFSMPDIQQGECCHTTEPADMGARLKRPDHLLIGRLLGICFYAIYYTY